MPHAYDKELMARGEAARRLIQQGEDPHRMLLVAVWPEGNWAEKALRAQLTTCPACSSGLLECDECGNTGAVTAERSRLLRIERLAAYAYEAA